MLEYAYRLRGIYFLRGLIDSKSVEEFYESLAHLLARRILDRTRRGLYRSYRPEEEPLPYIRGRIDLNAIAKRPWDVRIDCHFEDHTADLEENQILAWVLYRIAHSGACTERTLPTIRQAFRAMRGVVSLEPFGAEACVGRLYNRLNDDYQPMHAISRFFLEHSGPSHESGDRRMIPFLVDMDHLFELFIAEWLKAHKPVTVSVKSHQRVHIGQSGTLHFDIDLVLDDVSTGRALCVLDTKYKATDEPAAEDIAQVVAYAEARGCHEAFLVYPAPLRRPLEARIGDITIRTIVFGLDGDLETAGQDFLQELLEDLRLAA
jgi:5-methylcytosine-specific restriction enzyme subunit McrC